MKLTIARQAVRLLNRRTACMLPVLSLAVLLWGCTVAPQKKVYIEGMDRSLDAGEIVSTDTGRPVSFDALLADLKTCRIVYVGEMHTSVADHQIQLEVLRALVQDHPNLAVGMEMFDHTYQDVLNRWSAGELDQETFLRKVHWYANWRYDFSLYSDILNFIKDNHIRLVALNIPSDIPAKIRVGGIDNLRESEKQQLPRQIDLSNAAHRNYVSEVFGHHQLKGGVKFEDFYTAQVVWEDAMAERIAETLHNDRMVVLAGNGHIQFKYGIPQRAFKRTGVCFRTIYPVPAGERVEPDIADYIWVTTDRKQASQPATGH